MAPHSSTLAWKSHGRRSLVGCRLWGRTESDTTEATQQQQQQYSIQAIVSKIMKDHLITACVHAQSLQLCLTVCDPMDHHWPGSSVHGISRQEYWSGLPFPSPVKKYEVSEVKLLSRVQLFATPWTVAYIRLLCPWDFPGKNIGVGCHFLLLIIA